MSCLYQDRIAILQTEVVLNKMRVWETTQEQCLQAAIVQSIANMKQGKNQQKDKS